MKAVRFLLASSLLLAVVLPAAFGQVTDPGQTTSQTPSAPASAPSQTFSGDVSQTTSSFTVGDKWEVRWSGYFGGCNISVLATDGSVVAGGAGSRGVFFVPKGGTYHLQIDFQRHQLPNFAQQQQQQQPGTTGFQDTINGGLDQNHDPSSTNNQNGNGYSNPNNGNPQSHYPPISSHWTAEVVELSSPAAATIGNMPNFALPSDTSGSSLASATPPVTAPGLGTPVVTGAIKTAAAPGTQLTEDQARAVVLIKGDNAEGTGFMIRTPSGPAVITNIHVIANNPNLKITTNTGAFVTVLSEKGASDRDLAILSIQDAGYNYLEFSPDISKNVQPGDEVITPGNSQGGEVMLNTSGKVLGIGPVRLEFDNPIYHGNSGGPVFHPKSGKVLGVVTEAMKVDTSNDLDKASFASRNSAISGSMRYFGLRLDTVSAWIPIDSRRFQIETTFLDEFHEQSRRLDAYLNHSENDRDEAAKLYHSDPKIMKANDTYAEHCSGTDTAQRIDLIRSLVFDLQCVADIDMDQIRDKNNFYPFDQERAQDEFDYRAALKKELDSFSNNVEHASFMPRSNN